MIYQTDPTHFSLSSSSPLVAVENTSPPPMLFASVLELATQQIEKNIHEKANEGATLLAKEEKEYREHKKDSLSSPPEEVASPHKNTTATKEKELNGNNPSNRSVSSTVSSLPFLPVSLANTPFNTAISFFSKSSAPFESSFEIHLIPLSKEKLSHLFQEANIAEPLAKTPIDQIVEEIVQRATLIQKQGETQFILTLHPKEWGEIHITLSEQKEGLRVQIVTFREETRKAILQEENLLKDRLVALKYNVRGITIESCADKETLVEWPSKNAPN